MPETKSDLRKALRAERRRHVASLEGSTRSLLFMRPPAALLGLVPQNATVGLYRANPHEAPAASYARYFHDQGHPLALPRFAHREAPMEFAAHSDPHGESDLEVGPYGLMQPLADADTLTPDVLLVPLLGFTAQGERLGQGGGHYDRWLASHPGTVAIGMAWDRQLVEAIPTEAHDVPLAAVVTPTRLYGPFR